MKNNKHTDNVERLTSLGYSKTKSTLALRDAGNIFLQALQLLKSREVCSHRRTEGPLPGKTPVARPPTCATPVAPPGPSRRLHPCVVQYKKCQFGESCLLVNFPGDTCINYFHGTCLFGDHCKKRHVVGGVDIRQGRRPQLKSFLQREDAGKYDVIDQKDGVLFVKLREEEDSPDSHIPNLETDDDNSINDRKPSCTDKGASAEDVTDALPRPYLSALVSSENGVDVRSAPPARVTAPANAQPAKVRRHPCVAKFGFCKFGDNCQHALRAADVCLFFLQGKCNRTAEKCIYRHETEKEYAAWLRQDRLDEDVSTAAAVPTGSQAPTHPFQCPPPEQQEEVDISPVDEAEASLSAESKPNDKEIECFLWLLEAFPDRDPPSLLQALRAAGGDPSSAADCLIAKKPVSSQEMDAALATAFAKEEGESQRERALHGRSEALLTLHSLFPSVDIDSVQAALSGASGVFEDAFDVLLSGQTQINCRQYRSPWTEKSPAKQLRSEKLCHMFPDIDEEVVQHVHQVSEGNWNTAVTVLNQLTEQMLSIEERTAMGEQSTVWKPHAAHAFLQKARSHPTAPEAHSSPPPAMPACRSVEEAARTLRDVDKELRECSDWRRVRSRAYLVNKCRIQVLNQAASAFQRGDGAAANLLSCEGTHLAVEYQRLNRLAMLALEQERQKDPITTLDLHFYHVDEALEVLRRRVELCSRKGISHLQIVIGEGKHSRRGYGTVYPAVLKYLREDPYIASHVTVTSVKPAFLMTRIR